MWLESLSGKAQSIRRRVRAGKIPQLLILSKEMSSRRPYGTPKSIGGNPLSPR